MIFMDNDSLAYKTLKNISYSFFGFGVPILFSVFITPVVVHRLGIVDYGVYILVGTITGFMGLLDLGLSSAVIKYVSEHHAQNNFRALQKTVNSAFSLYCCVGLLGLMIFYILGVFFLPIFHISGLSQSHILIVFILSGIIFFVRSASLAYMVIPQALQRFDISTKINLFQLAFFNFAMLLAVLAGYKLKVILSLNLFSLLALAWAYRVFSLKLLPAFRLGLAWDVGEIKKLYKFGFFASLASIANSSLDQLDRLIIPIFLGPAALSYYSLPGNVSQKTTTIVGSLGGIFFPLASSLKGIGDEGKLKVVYQKIVRNLTVAAAAITTAIMCFGYQILFYWLGKDFADRGFMVLLISGVTYFILSLYGILFNFLLGLGKTKFMSAWAFVLAVLNLVLLLVLLPVWGIVGAAWAYLGGVLPILFMFYWMETKYLGVQNFAGFYLKLYWKIFVVSSIFFLLTKYLLLRLIFNLNSLILVGPASIVLYLAIYKMFGFFDAEDWDLFVLFFNKILLKFRGAGKS